VVRCVLRKCGAWWNLEAQNGVLGDLPPYGVARRHAYI